MDGGRWWRDRDGRRERSIDGGRDGQGKRWRERWTVGEMALEMDGGGDGGRDREMDGGRDGGRDGRGERWR